MREGGDDIIGQRGQIMQGLGGFNEKATRSMTGTFKEVLRIS